MKLIEDWLKALQLTNIDLGLMKSAFTHGSFKGLGQNVDDYQRLEILFFIKVLLLTLNINSLFLITKF